MNSYSISTATDVVKGKSPKSGTGDNVTTTTSATVHVRVDTSGISAETSIGVNETENDSETTPQTSNEDYMEQSASINDTVTEETNAPVVNKGDNGTSSTLVEKDSFMLTSAILTTNDKMTTTEQRSHSVKVNFTKVTKESVNDSDISIASYSPAIEDSITTSSVLATNDEIKTTENDKTTIPSNKEVTNPSVVTNGTSEKSTAIMKGIFTKASTMPANTDELATTANDKELTKEFGTTEISASTLDEESTTLPSVFSTNGNFTGEKSSESGSGEDGIIITSTNSYTSGIPDLTTKISESIHEDRGKTVNGSYRMTSTSYATSIDISDISTESLTGVNETVNDNEIISTTPYMHQDYPLPDENREDKNDTGTNNATPEKSSTRVIEKSTIIATILTTNKEMGTTEPGTLIIDSDKDVTSKSSHGNARPAAPPFSRMLGDSTATSAGNATYDKMTTTGRNRISNTAKISNASVTNNDTTEKFLLQLSNNSTITSKSLDTNNETTTLETGPTITDDNTEIASKSPVDNDTLGINEVLVGFFELFKNFFSNNGPSIFQITDHTMPSISTSTTEKSSLPLTRDNMISSSEYKTNEEMTTTEADPILIGNASRVINDLTLNNSTKDKSSTLVTEGSSYKPTTMSATNNEMLTMETGSKTTGNATKVTNTSVVNKDSAEKSSTPVMKGSSMKKSAMLTKKNEMTTETSPTIAESTTEITNASPVSNVTTEMRSITVTNDSIVTTNGSAAVNNITITEISPTTESKTEKNYASLIDNGTTETPSSGVKNNSLITTTSFATVEKMAITETNLTEKTKVSDINNNTTGNFSVPVEGSKMTSTGLTINENTCITIGQPVESGSFDDAITTASSNSRIKRTSNPVMSKSTMPSTTSAINEKLTNMETDSIISETATDLTSASLVDNDTTEKQSSPIMEVSSITPTHVAITDGIAVEQSSGSGSSDSAVRMKVKIMVYKSLATNDKAMTTNVPTTNPSSAAQNETRSSTRRSIAEDNRELNNKTTFTSSTIPSNAAKTTYKESTGAGSRASWVSSSNWLLVLSNVLAVYRLFVARP